MKRRSGHALRAEEHTQLQGRGFQLGSVALLAALGNRIEEEPARIRDALIPFAMSYPSRPRELALRALGRLRESEMPPKLREAFDNSIHPTFPVRAALAMKLDHPR